MDHCPLILFLCPQCVVTVTDEGYPRARTDDITMIFTVQRDVEIPVFTQEDYRATASETLAVNGSVGSVQAELGLIMVSTQSNLWHCMA